MPSYVTLTVFALVASTVSPALSAPVQVTREQALNSRELVSGRRGLFGGAAKVGEAELGGEAKVAAKKGWGSKLKSFGLSLLVGGVAASAGTDIYSHMNPNSPALGGTGESESTTTPATTGYSTTDPSAYTTGPGYATSPSYTTGPGYTTSPSYATGPGYATSPSYTTGSGYATGPGSTPTVPSTTGTQTTATRAIAERAGGERALDSKLPVEIFTRSDSNLNSRTSPHMNLLSRTDLEKAISLFRRMLDELD